MDYSILKPKYYKDPKTNEVAGIMYKPNGFTITVPIDSDNRHYQAIQEWVAEGNKIEDAD